MSKAVVGASCARMGVSVKVLRRCGGGPFRKPWSCDSVPSEETVRVEVAHEGA